MSIARSWRALILALGLAVLAPAPSHLRAAAPAEPTGSVTLRQALAAALLGNPELAAFSHEVRAREARILQAGLLPNPEALLEAENVGGSGNRQGFEQTETTLRLSQLLELGGKRGKRVRVAETERDVAGLDYESKRREVAATVMRAFAAVLAAQEEVVLAAELEKIAVESVGAVEAQVRAGAAPEVEVARARVALGRAQAERVLAERQLAAARIALAASWGGSEPLFGRARGELAELPPLPAREELLERLGDNPDLRRSRAEIRQQQATLELAEARAIPNVAIGAGGRHFSNNGDNALVFELAVPLPLFDRNQGAIQEAHDRLARARAESDGAEIALRAALSSAWERLAAARERAALLGDQILPQARASLDGARDAYRRGLYRSLDVLDAQRTLFDVRVDYVRTLANLHAAAADVERLAGTTPAGGERP